MKATIRFALVFLSLPIFAWPAFAQNLEGTWDLQASAQLPEATNPCVVEGSVDIVQSGSSLAGSASFMLVSGPAECPSEIAGTIDGLADGSDVFGTFLGGAFGTASFEGPISNDGASIQGTFSVVEGPFSGAEGAWSAAAAEPDSELVINKNADGETYSFVGDVIGYTITVNNTGDVTQTGVTVSDPQVDPLDCTPAVPAELAPGEAVVCTGSHEVTAADIDNAGITNTASADSDQIDPVSDQVIVAFRPLTFSIASATGTGTIIGGIGGIGGGEVISIAGVVATTAEAAAGDGPPNVGFPHGLLAIRVDGVSEGGTVDFTITFPGPLPENTRYWKYGPTPDNATPHWYIHPATIDGDTVTFSITDGGPGDHDLTANGTIDDPGGTGIVVPPVPVPALTRWAVVVLMLMLMIAIYGRLQARGSF